VSNLFINDKLILNEQKRFLSYIKILSQNVLVIKNSAVKNPRFIHTLRYTQFFLCNYNNKRPFLSKGYFERQLISLNFASYFS